MSLTQKYFKVIYKDYELQPNIGLTEVLKEEIIEWNVSKYDDRQSYRVNLNFASLTILDAGFVDVTPPSGSPVKFVPVHCIVQITEHQEPALQGYNQPEKSIAFGKESVEAFSVNPKCGCSDCNPNSNWMILCPTCGNKRCPKAQNHGNECTNSNEVGQKGSSWEHVKPATQNSGHNIPKRYRKQKRIEDDKDEIIRNNPEDAENKIVDLPVEKSNESETVNENQDASKDENQV